MNPVIEILRVLGALMVLTHHYTFKLSSDLADHWFSLHFFHNGVDMFFVITGYLFAPFLLNDKKLHALTFLKRRFFRLYPLYLLSLLIYIATVSDNTISLIMILEHLFLLQALPYHSLSEVSIISTVYWTLAVEFQFYLLVVVLQLLYKHVTIKHKILFLFLLSMVSYLVSAYCLYQPQTEDWFMWQIQLPALLIEFFFGVVIYKYYVDIKNKWQVLVFFLINCAFLIALYIHFPKAASQTLTVRPSDLFNILSAFAYAGLMASFLAYQALMKNSYPATKKIVISLGGLSYAVYLFHAMTIRWVWLRPDTLTNEMWATLALGITLVIAWGINRFVEIPCRDYGRR